MKITPRDKKLLIAGAVAVCLFSVTKFALFPIYDTIVGQHREIQVKEGTLEKYLKFIERQSELQKQLKRLSRDERRSQRSLLEGETPSLAAADIQKIVDTIAGKSEVEITSVKVMDPGQKEGFTTIPIRVMFTSDLQRTEKFVKSIETSRKLLTIPELKIRVKNKRKPADIVVTLQVLGFMKKKESGKEE